MNNYFAAEKPIKDLLDASFKKDKVTVLSAGDLTASQGKQIKLPAIYVIHAGDEIRTPQSPGPAQLYYQYWSIVVVAKSPTSTGKMARDSAGPIIQTVIDTLQGVSLRKQLPNAAVALARVNGEEPLYADGRIYFDLRFSIGIQS